MLNDQMMDIVKNMNKRFISRHGPIRVDAATYTRWVLIVPTICHFLIFVLRLIP